MVRLSTAWAIFQGLLVEALLYLDDWSSKHHDGEMENDFAVTIQKYILYVLLGVGLFAALGLVVFLIKLIF